MPFSTNRERVVRQRQDQTWPTGGQVQTRGRREIGCQGLPIHSRLGWLEIRSVKRVPSIWWIHLCICEYIELDFLAQTLENLWLQKSLVFSVFYNSTNTSDQIPSRNCCSSRNLVSKKRIQIWSLCFVRVGKGTRKEAYLVHTTAGSVIIRKRCWDIRKLQFLRSKVTRLSEQSRWKGYYSRKSSSRHRFGQIWRR